MGGLDMAGRFEGLSDAEWKLFEDIFSGKERVPVTGGSSHGILTGRTLNELKSRILSISQTEGRSSGIQEPLTALFPPGKGGDEGVRYGYKGKGVLIHVIVDAEGMPLSALSTSADADERKQVKPLLDGIKIKTGRAGRPAKKKKACR
ncbi:MAG: hypothetical protein ACTFAK_07915 [Candidatus Electronema sp. VV]